ncbi:MAG: hypothetical protein COA79_12800 [Planctomycetota bacterium]|nr:MAG: hypothetical protein COA79_12800 [Planctomycetota bacterium]
MNETLLSEFTGPKYEQVKSWIRKQITEGAFPVDSQLPSQEELPGILNVGSTAVRRALDDLKKEGLIIRKKKAGSFVAQNPKPLIFENRNVNIGIIWPQSVIPDFLHGNYYSTITHKILSALDLELNDTDWTPRMESQSTQCSWQNNSGNIQVTCMGDPLHSHVCHPRIEDVKGANFDVIISICIENDLWLKELIDTGIPVILVDFAKEIFRTKADQIFFDPVPGYSDAVHYFASKGFTRIHFIGAKTPCPAPTDEMGRDEWHEYRLKKYNINPDSVLRLSAFRHAMHECGLPPIKDCVHHEFHRVKSLTNLANQLVSLPKNKRPEVVICHSDYHAEVISNVFTESGISLNSIGAFYDSMEGVEYCIYADLNIMAQATAELVISRLNRPKRVPFRLAVPMFFKNNKEQIS